MYCYWYRDTSLGITWYRIEISVLLSNTIFFMYYYIDRIILVPHFCFDRQAVELFKRRSIPMLLYEGRACIHRIRCPIDL